jgi:fimbrial chaperone protein
MTTFPVRACALCLGALAVGAAQAGPLQVEPVLVEVTAPGAASTLTLRGNGTPVEAQVRVFRWVQANGEDRLEPTTDVVASPPALSLKSDAPHVVRIVRVAKTPVAQEESYRLLVDQLPNLAQQRGGTVNLILRQSIPVFFKPAGAAGSKLTWSLAQANGKAALVAHNSGDRRVRVSDLKVRDGHGPDVTIAAGLAGYVLPGATKRWALPGGHGAAGGTLRVAAQGDTGPIDAAATSASRH